MVTNAISGYAEVNDGRFYWEVAGAGEPIVFVHGFTLDSRMWDDQWESFAEGYRVIRYDSRGFGRSSLPTGPFSHQDDLRALLDYLEIETFHAVGLSMGGSTCLDYAVVKPVDLRSLTLIDSGPGGGISAAAMSHAEVYRSQGLATAKETWMGGELFVSLERQPEVRARVAQMVEDYSGWHWMNLVEQIVPFPPSVERLQDIRVPTLVMVGNLDAPRMLENAETLAKIPGARKVVIENAGHMANMEQPEAVNAALHQFLAEQAKGQS